jgi:hypothetical protein
MIVKAIEIEFSSEGTNKSTTRFVVERSGWTPRTETVHRAVRLSQHNAATYLHRKIWSETANGTTNQASNNPT